MPLRARPGSGFPKILVITGCWMLILLATNANSYLLIQDLVALGKLSGDYDFWPDLWGNAVIGAVSGATCGSLLVHKVNAGYRHRTFLSGILVSAALFVALYVSFAVLVVFLMPFVLFTVQEGVGEGLARGLSNIRANLYTPSFLSGMVVFGGMVAGTQFMLQVNDKFGPGILWKLMTGKYYHPRAEERVFMFLDLRASTEIAERIGHQRFFELLRELFQDVTKPVIQSLGEIYQYVGDEVVITWPVERAFENDNCIACYFRIREALAEKRQRYLDLFGVSPDFKAGVHVGGATVGEIGVVKKDIVFSGDVLNTTARIQGECNRLQADLLASSELVGRMALGGSYAAVPVGRIHLRGKSEPLELVTVQVDVNQSLRA